MLGGLATGISRTSSAWRKAPLAVKFLVWFVVLCAAGVPSSVTLYKLFSGEKPQYSVATINGPAQIGERNTQNNIQIGKSPRRISENREQVLSSRLRGQAALVYTAMAPMNDVEADQFLRVLIVILGRSGWICSDPNVRVTGIPPLPPGVTVVTNDANYSTAKIVADWLSESGFDARLELNNAEKNMHFSVGQLP